ncbi:uncharacterized protein K489DRAFT_379524 [Dissoconium aciculare CBS 342.82]|uniref:Uncharacterized protein n=1 Tax=Dissoconium aciculare CBS 342.82 TaxID=1314786 RepID=A0A6J3M9P6_9PEZI|nr:uncharacterized protein K489DRAFT_379524 [Dissoconium aciculare CBS 342.82]KAF1823532.1 hypothetical protein K489DRAFT_379524 [Dissoconium aciculare CBS 342.82]
MDRGFMAVMILAQCLTLSSDCYYPTMLLLLCVVLTTVIGTHCLNFPIAKVYVHPGVALGVSIIPLVHPDAEEDPVHGWRNISDNNDNRVVCQCLQPSLLTIGLLVGRAGRHMQTADSRPKKSDMVSVRRLDRWCSLPSATPRPFVCFASSASSLPLARD